MTTPLLQRLRHFLCAAPLAALLTLSSLASAEPPSRVGRLSFMQGDVSFFMDRDEGWRRAQLNFPVSSENSLWTENGGRAEVRIGASALRIDDRSILDFVRIEDDQTLAFLQRGTLNLRIRTDDGGDRSERRNDGDTFRIETREGQFVFSRNGRYRIDASPEAGESRVSVYAGRARFESGDGGDSRINVEAGKSLAVRGSGGASDFHFESANESQFDRWADARDQNWNQIHTRYVRERNVSPYMTGYEDLDQYGDWIDDGEYGRLWTPRAVVSDWAPYRYGRWANVQPWGWTWVDDAAWGFAPFHYGRWVQVRSRWAWWPGPYVRRPAYAPALVAWFNRPGVSISISSGPSVGWFPLAPREHYLPGYSNNVTYIRNINYVTNNVTIINPPSRYVNQLPGATVVQNNVFLGGQSIGRNIAPVPPAVINAQIAGSGVNFGPRFTRQEGGNGNGNGPRDGRRDDRRPPPSYAPPSYAPSSPGAPVPPILPAPVGQFVPGAAGGVGGVPGGVNQQFNKPAPQASAGGALPVVNGQPVPLPPRVKSAPIPAQTMPFPNPSAPAQPVYLTPAAAPPAPVRRDSANPPLLIDGSAQAPAQRPRRERQVIERAPAPQNAPAAVNQNERSMGDRAVRVPQNAGEPRSVPRPQAATEHEGKPKAVAVPKPRPVPIDGEPKGDGQNRVRSVER